MENDFDLMSKPQKKQRVRDILAEMDRGGSVYLEDPKMVRLCSRNISREKRKRMFLGRDDRHRLTKITLL